MLHDVLLGLDAARPRRLRRQQTTGSLPSILALGRFIGREMVRLGIDMRKSRKKSGIGSGKRDTVVSEDGWVEF